jgi:calcium channel MID1
MRILLPQRRNAWTGLLVWLLFTHTPISSICSVSATDIQPLFSDKDHNHPQILDETLVLDTDWEDEEPASNAYEAEFAGISRAIIGRQDTGTVVLQNNIPVPGTVQSGQTLNFAFEVAKSTVDAELDLPSIPPFSGLSKRSVEVVSISNDGGEFLVHSSLKKRQDTTQTVFISLNVCDQTDELDQLTLYISQSVTTPGPGQSPDQTLSVPMTQGYANFNMTATGTIYLGVYAPDAAGAPDWNFVVGASVDGYVQSFAPDISFAFVVDTDSASVLISTSNLTDPSALTDDLRNEWTATTPPFQIFVFDANTSLDGVRNSYCALNNMRIDNVTVQTAISTRNVGHNPKQNFYVQGLQPGTLYQAVLALNGSKDAAGTNTLEGGQVWKSFSFVTKSGMSWIVKR